MSNPRGVKAYGIAAIRAIVAERVAASSLREVAKDIGMSHSGLRSFLKTGSKPQDSKLKLLKEYVQRLSMDIEDPAEKIDPAELESAKLLLARYVMAPTPSVRERRVEEVKRDVIGEE